MTVILYFECRYKQRKMQAEIEAHKAQQNKLLQHLDEQILHVDGQISKIKSENDKADQVSTMQELLTHYIGIQETRKGVPKVKVRK